jgi:nucleotide-binding universal stress UspA family protein
LLVLRVCADGEQRARITDRDADLAEETRALRIEGVAAHYLLHVGAAEKQIIATAVLQQSTLIIIASRRVGPRALPQRRMTARLAAHARAPVLVMPELDSAIQSDLFGAEGAPVLVALDGSVLAEQALPYAAELATLLRRPLALVFVALPLLTQPELAAAWAYIEAARRRVRETITRDMHVDAQVVSGAPVDELLWAAEGRQAAAVVLTARGKSGLSSQRASNIALEALSRATVPVLIIPTPVLAAGPAPSVRTSDNPQPSEP